MNLFKTLAMVGLVGVGVVWNGVCAETNNPKLDLQQKIKESKKIFVYLPAITPFDSDLKLRDLYLDQYQTGYRNIVAELYLEPDIKGFVKDKHVTEPIYNAFIQGWSDGQLKALKDHPEKVKVTSTIYRTDGKGISTKPDTGLYIDSSKAGVNIQE